MARVTSFWVVVLIGAAGCGGGPVHGIGGSGHLEVRVTQAANVGGEPGDVTAVVVEAHDRATGTLVMGAIKSEPEKDGFWVKRWQVMMTVIGEPSAGRSYTLGAAAAAASGNGSLTYDELPAGGQYRAWKATGGAVVVSSMAGRSATFAFTGLPMAPSEGGTGNEAQGTFELSGTLTVDDLDNVFVE
jgi:hypothetical protein